jgi:tetratricopeptide (TPR) repeat protein
VVVCAIFLMLSTSPVLADPVTEAKNLKAEAQQILRSASGGAADPKVYAKAVVMLERAEALLEEAAKSHPKSVEGVQEEVTAALFWARRFANVNVIQALRSKESGSRLSKTNPSSGEPEETDARKPGPEKPVQTKKPEPKPPVAPPPPRHPVKPAAPKKLATESEAEVAYKKAMAFEKAHSDDHYAVALRWFQMADQFSGTLWSMKALTHARTAQRLFRAAKKNAELAKSEDGKLIVQGNALLDKKQFLKALRKFEAAKKIKPTVLAERSIGYTYLKVGYKKRDEYKSKYLPLMKRYQQARRMGNRTQMAILSRQAKALRPLERDVIHCYTQAKKAFSRGIRLADGKDLECEAQMGIIHYWMKKRPLAKICLRRVINRYTPQSDEERAVYEYSKTLLELIGG